MISSTTRTKDDEGRFYVTWTTDSAVKRVEITSRETGARAIGTDWANWDVAYQQALHRMFSPTTSRSRHRT